MIKNLDKYKKHITQENGELKYRGYLIRVRRTITLKSPRVSNVVIYYEEAQGYEGETVKRLKEETETSNEWMVYYEKNKPIHYSALAFPLESIFEEIDDYHKDKKKNTP